MLSLIRALGVRTGEGRLIAHVGVLFATVEAGRGLGEVGVDTLVLSRLGPSALPYLFIGLGVVGLGVSLVYGGALGRIRRDRLLPALLLVAAAVLAVERLVTAARPDLGFPLLWISVYATGTLLVTISWTIAGSVLDARQAKRLFPLGTSAAILGGFVGMLAAGPLAGLLGAANLVVIQALLIVAAAILAARLTDRLRRTARETGRVPFAAAIAAGARATVASPLMRLVAVAYLLFAVLMFSISFPFYRAMSEAFPSEAGLASALGLFSAAVTAASFLVSTLVAGRVYRAIGVTGGAFALPLVYLAGFATWLVQFSLSTAVAVRLVQQVTQRGVSNAAWSAFFNVVPAERRGQVLAFIDGIPGQVGTALSGILLLAATALAPGQVFWLGLGAAAACTIVVRGARRRYGESLVRTLREGLAEQVLEGGPGIEALGRDPRVVADLSAALRDGRPAERRLAALLLARIGAESATRALATAAGDADPAVQSAALRAIAALRPESTRDGVSEAIARVLDHSDPAVRAAAVAAAAACDRFMLVDVAPRLAIDPSPGVRAEVAIALIVGGEEDRPHAILAALLDSSASADRRAGLDAVRRLGGHAPSPRIAASLHDPEPAVRAAAVAAVAVVTEGLDNVDDLLIAALEDPARIVRDAAADALRERAAAVEPILELIYRGTHDARMAGLAALRDRGAEVAPALLRWAEVQVRRAAALRRHAMVVSGTREAPGRADTGAFLRYLLERRVGAAEIELLAALSVLGATEASGLIRRCLHSNEPEVRAQALEALDALGDRRLARAVVELLELEPPDATIPLRDVLVGLAGDPDPWVRALALRMLSEALAAERAAVLERVADDPDPLVRMVVGAADDGGSEVPETRATLGEVERIMFLRRVPLFAQLEPEDLQRLASTATERFYPGGEALVREGELGDELVVIVDGSVRVVRRDGDGERLLRVYHAGDHIGELAVLRERPRAASVVADEPGVRGLVIGGDGVKAILRERPEAAWAMLTTLAERISTQ
jgi:HEAT repeat protein